jgi:hypothetical protein
MIGLVEIKGKDNGFFDIRSGLVYIKSIGKIFCVECEQA